MTWSATRLSRVWAGCGAQPARKGRAEPGCLFHWVTKTEVGTRAVDVWESMEAFTRFIDERLGPVLRDRGMARPQVRTLNVHNYLIA